MTGDDPHSPVIPQCHKVGHPSRRVALAALRDVLRAFDAAGKDRTTLEVYKCRRCRTFHLGRFDAADRRHTRAQRDRDRRRDRDVGGDE